MGNLFSDVIGGDMVSRCKSAPDTYLHAAKALGLPPHRLTAFEDWANGVRAAHAAGMITVQVPDVILPDDDLKPLGHHIAADLIAGARHIGLMALLQQPLVSAKGIAGHPPEDR